MNLPLEFLDNMRSLLGDGYEDYISSMESERLYGLRVNTSKISALEFERISPFHLTKIPYIPNGYYYDGASDQPAKHPYYFAGLYYLQDPSAMTPASRLPMSSGLRVLDLCAAPGGKSTELAARLCGQGVLVANDISAKRAKALQKNIALFGIKNCVITTEYPSKLAERFEGYFDRILVDAPCSGEGMFRKDPAMVGSWTPDSPTEYAALQSDILKYAIKMLAPGGYLLYSTCTFSPIEDEGSVTKILEADSDLEIEKPEWYEGFATGMPEAIGSDDLRLKNCIRIFPHMMDGEGHFLALLKKKDVAKNINKTSDNITDNPKKIKKKSKKTNKKQKDNSHKNNRLSKEEKLLWEDFSGDFDDELNKIFDDSHIESHDGKLYYVSDDIPDVTGLRFIRRGLYLGECKKSRFEPSQELAMAIRAEQYSSIVNLSSDDERVIKYLKGETISVGEQMLLDEMDDNSSADESDSEAGDLENNNTCRDGIVLICVDGYPLGWGKKSGSNIKNKYLASWRMM